MTCALCALPANPAKDGLCRACRLRSYTVVKYPWTPEMDRQLTRAYRGSRNKAELTERLKEIMRRTGYPRYILGNRAATLDLVLCTRRGWTANEVMYLLESDGAVSIKRMAKHLGRSYSAVQQKLFTLDMLGGVTDGFSQRELARLMGVHHARVERWVGRGWLAVDGDTERVTHESVERFVWEHMEEYRFAACEEWWLKTMLKPAIGRREHADAHRARQVAA